MTLIGNVYRWIASRFSSRPTNFSWVIKDQLAGSGLPITLKQFNWLIDHGITAIITVREVPLPLGWVNLYAQHAESSKGSNNSTISYLHVPVEDYKAPSMDQIKSTVSYIEDRLAINGSSVLVHCAAGKGRTGTILAAYLMKKDRYSADETIRRLRTLRPGSIQTEVQEQAIHAYADYLDNS
ncbi:MAG TPA: dual specificity protein phosphatase 23 [Nitrososphaeraceae archaeon]|jgi:atypical dual specificity phosphatase